MDVRLPQLAEGADSGTVVNILVSPGDKIRKDQTLLELENQKAVAPIPAPANGTVTKVHVKQGDVVSVGQVLVSLSEGEAAQDQGGTSAPQTTAASRQTPQDYRYESKSGLPPPASPSLRKMAKDLGLDLARIRGSGHGGRILIEDVRSYLTALQRGGGSSPAPEPRAAAPKIDFAKWGPVSRKAMTPTRQAIAKAMTASWREIPHVTIFEEADSGLMLDLVKKYEPAYANEGLKLTLTALVLLALVRVLKKHPLFNSSLDEAAKEIVLKEYVHFGIAVDTEAGLLVPVLRDAHKKTLREICRSLQELAEKSRSRKLTLEDLQGGTFTISNQGVIGGAHFTPIIHQPEVAILGLGRSKKKEGKAMLPLSLSYDHRVLDGADSARFMRDLAQALETFLESEIRR